MRTNEFITALGISPQQACDWRREGIGPDWIRLPGGKAIRYDRESVNNFIEERRLAPMSRNADDVNEQRDAAKVNCEAVRRKLAGDPDWMLGLKGTPTVLAVRLMEAISLLSYVASLSDRPNQFLDELERAATEGS